MKAPILLTALFTCALNSNAQQFTSTLSPAMGAHQPETFRAYDLVGPDMRPTKDLSVAMQRSVSRTAEGYAVRVVDVDGVLRMTGLYADAALTTQHGPFSFFHANGQLESTGNYVNGLKKGVWMRYDVQGKPLAERVYGAGSYEELALEHGWAMQAGQTQAGR